MASWQPPSHCQAKVLKAFQVVESGGGALVARQMGVTVTGWQTPLPSEEGTPSNVSRTLT